MSTTVCEGRVVHRGRLSIRFWSLKLGRNVFIPLSEVKDMRADRIEVSTWIAKKKGLL